MPPISTALVASHAAKLGDTFTTSELVRTGVGRKAIAKAISGKLLVVARSGSKVLVQKTGTRGRPAVLYRLSAKGRKA